MPSTPLGKNVIIDDKDKLTNSSVLPLGQPRYIVVSPTREMYYDDGSNRYKIRDIQIVSTTSDLTTIKAVAYDLCFVVGNLSFYYYSGTNWQKINVVSTSITSGDTNAVSGGAVYTALSGKANKFSTTFTVEVGAATVTVNHNLNTRNVIVQVFDSNYDTVYIDTVRNTVNSIQLKFAGGATSSQAGTYTVVVIG